MTMKRIGVSRANIGRQFDAGPKEVKGQLPMFMTGREILRSTSPNDAHWHRIAGEGGPGRMWRKKLEAVRSGSNTGSEGKAAPLAEAIKHGVERPVLIGPSEPGGDGNDALVNGHHRTIAAAVFAPKNLLTVKWDHNMFHDQGSSQDRNPYGSSGFTA